MHVDLWMQRKLVDKKGNIIQLMSILCDLTQFSISQITHDATSETLSKFFMENGVLTFGMVAIVIVDADRKFRHLFEEMCASLKTNSWILARGSHKSCSVECYH